LASQALSNGEIRHIATGDKDGGLRFEELGQSTFQFFVKRVVAGSLARSGDVQTKAFESILDCPADGRMRRETKIIAAGEVGELAALRKDVGLVHLLDWWRQRSSGVLGSCI